MELLEKIFVCAGLGINAYLDLKYRRISLVLAAVLGCFGIGKMLLMHDLAAVNIMWGLLPGGVCLILACVAGQSVGFGDAWIMLAVGSILGGAKMIQVSMLALGMAAVCALLLLCFFHKSGKYEIPFVPFLLLGYGIVCLGAG